MSQLIHLVYSSDASVAFSDLAVKALLEGARRNNSALGVTGVLLHIDSSFLQVLEGELTVVESLYEKIGLDKRHTRVKKLIQEPIQKRDFEDWSMGLAKITSKELSVVPGFNDFWKSRRALESLGEGLTRKVLTAFREDGRWRSRVAA